MSNSAVLLNAQYPLYTLGRSCQLVVDLLATRPTNWQQVVVMELVNDTTQRTFARANLLWTYGETGVMDFGLRLPSISVASCVVEALSSGLDHTARSCLPVASIPGWAVA